MCRCLPIALIAVAAALVALPASPAFAYHGAHEGSAATGGGYFEALLPIVVVVGLVMAGLMFWGRKKPKAKSKRRKRRQGR